MLPVEFRIALNFVAGETLHLSFERRFGPRFAVWGTNPHGPPDFDGDGTVNTVDLLILFANWGPCE